MELAELRTEALAANLALPANGLVTLTWGNASAVDRERGLVAIKPSGVSYGALTAEDIVVLSLSDGDVVEGSRRPSTDTPTHLALYEAYPEIGAVVHTHSTWATVWAQAGRQIPLLGTTHADLCPYPIPITRALTPEEVADDYEGATGAVLIEALANHGPVEVPCVLVRGHAPFCWGVDAAAAVEHAVTLEEVAHMALFTTLLERGSLSLDAHVREKHYARKHGPGAYYGQASLEG
jgi:L-ribulose-5-phosphate 4-epimerase